MSNDQALLGLDGSQESRIHPFGQEAELTSGPLGTLLWPIQLHPLVPAGVQECHARLFLLRLFGAPEGELTAEAILSEGVVVGAIPWGIEQRVEEAGRGVHVPGGAWWAGCRCWLREVLQWGHESQLVCHPGIRRTLFAIRQCFWWPILATDVRTVYVLACPTCA